MKLVPLIKFIKLSTHYLLWRFDDDIEKDCTKQLENNLYTPMYNLIEMQLPVLKKTVNNMTNISIKIDYNIWFLFRDNIPPGYYYLQPTWPMDIKSPTSHIFNIFSLTIKTQKL